MDFINWIKAGMEALNFNISRKIAVAISSILLLTVKLIINLNQKQNYFDIWFWILLILALFSFSTAMADYYDQKKKLEKESIERRKRKEKVVFDKEEKIRKKKLKSERFERYLMNLSTTQIQIVSSVYYAPHKREYLSDNDSDVVDLVAHNVLLMTSRMNYFDEYINGYSERNDPRHVYIFTPQMTEIMKTKAKEVLNKKSA